jgi:hypothetical protein
MVVATDTTGAHTMTFAITPAACASDTVVLDGIDLRVAGMPACRLAMATPAS